MNEPRRVMVGIPSYDGKVTVATMFSVVGDMTTPDPGTRYTLKINSGCGLIARSRNLITAAFLASDCTDLFFVDADIGWAQGAMHRLVNAPVEMVAGIYPKRTDRYRDFPVLWWTEDGKMTITGDKDTGLFRAVGVPTGFLRLRRSVIEKMVAAYGAQTKHTDQDSPLPDKVCYALFDHEISDDIYWGEDYTFCRRWSRIGGQIWVDADLHFQHVGDKAFEGNLWTWLNEGMPGHPAYTKAREEAAPDLAPSLAA